MEDLKSDLKKIAAGEIQEIERVREILCQADQLKSQLHNEHLHLVNLILSAESQVTRGVPRAFSLPEPTLPENLATVVVVMSRADHEAYSEWKKSRSESPDSTTAG